MLKYERWWVRITQYQSQFHATAIRALKSVYSELSIYGQPWPPKRREEWFSPNTSHVRGRAGYGQSTWYCRRSRLDSILVYCTANKVYNHFGIREDENMKDNISLTTL
jgi:hypothetical protein